MKKEKNYPKNYNNNEVENFLVEPDTQLTEDLTEPQSDLTNLPDETLTEALTEDLTEDLTPFPQVCSDLGISRETGYKRMDFLQINPWKIKGRVHLDRVQVNHMEGLHKYYKEHGKLDGYPIPSPSGPQEEKREEKVEQTTATDATAITVSEPQQLNTSTNSSSFTPTKERSQATPEMEAINNLVRSAQNKATGVLIAENVLAQQYIANPESLPNDLKEKIRESAQTPVIDPFAYASELINFARSGGAVG